MKIEITEYKTIKTTIEIDCNSLEETKELYYKGHFDEEICNAEVEQWNVRDTQTEFNIIN